MVENEKINTVEIQTSRTLNASVERVFRFFTERGHDWWPREYRLTKSERVDLVLEPRAGGRWYERGSDGTECDWGRVLEWDPPHRLVLSWQIGVGFVPQSDPERASRVEVRFEAEGSGTRLTLTHSQFERHGDGWESMRDSVAGGGGWTQIVEGFAARAEAEAGIPGGAISAPVSVRVTHRFDASAERVFDAWLDEEMIGRWMFGPNIREEKVLHLSTDPRVGGAYSFLVRRQSEEIDHVGRYLEIDRPRRLAFTWGIAGESDEESRVIIEIVPDGSGCVLTLTHELDPKWADYAGRTEEAWSEMLSVLETALSA